MPNVSLINTSNMASATKNISREPQTCNVCETPENKKKHEL